MLLAKLAQCILLILCYYFLYSNSLFILFQLIPINASKAESFLLQNSLLQNQPSELNVLKKETQLPAFYFNFSTNQFYWHGSQNQYHNWLKKVLLWDFGISHYTHENILTKIFPALVRSFFLAIIASVFTIAFSIIIGGYLATINNNKLIKTLQIVSIVFNLIPPVWVAFGILLASSAFNFNSYEPISYQHDLYYYLNETNKLLLPSITIILSQFIFWLIYFHNLFRSTLAQDFIRSHKAMGASTGKLLFYFSIPLIIKPSLPTIIQWFVSLFNGSIIIERIFNLQGIGWLTYQSIMMRDLAVAIALLSILGLISISTFVFINVAYLEKK